MLKNTILKAYHTSNWNSNHNPWEGTKW